MKKILTLLIVVVLTSCSSNSHSDLEFKLKNLDLPMKILFGAKKLDSTYVYLCFPKRIVYNNNTSISNKVIRYTINYTQVGSNSRVFRGYKYEDSLVYPNSFKIGSMEKDSLNFYFGYSLKLDNSELDNLIEGKNIIQVFGKLKVYNLPVTSELKEWANSMVTDSMMKAQLHFKLHNKEKGFYYKSLDLELFEE